MAQPDNRRIKAKQARLIPKDFMSETPDNLLAAIMDAWKDAPHKAISLRDMIEFAAHQMVSVLFSLGEWREISFQTTRSPGGAAVVPDDTRRHVVNLLGQLQPLCRQLVLPAAEDRIRVFRNVLMGLSDSMPVTHGLIAHEIGEIQANVAFELAARKLVFIANDKQQYLERDDLFGEPFHKRASKAINTEIKAVGNCLAADLNTAAVFHLMRVAEFGLHKLVEDMTAKGVAVSICCPIEFSTWGKVIGAIMVELRRLKGTPTTASREEELHFYSLISEEFQAIQFLWRDPVMHARFDEPHEAENAYRHIKRFMQELATRVPLM